MYLDKIIEILKKPQREERVVSEESISDYEEKLKVKEPVIEPRTQAETKKPIENV